VTINDGCYITSLFSITIGNGTSIGEYTSIRDYDHEFDDLSRPIKDQGYKGKPIDIGKDCWIGRGCMITSGVRIGEGAVVGANSVVTHDIPAFSVAVGAPARVLRKRGTSAPGKPESSPTG
jgi:acetyltransferase-like isoleucine patch superfamily enzyme